MTKKKKVTAPVTHDPGRGRPKEHLAYLNYQEMEALKRLNGNNVERGPKGLPSFADDSASSMGVSRPPSTTTTTTRTYSSPTSTSLSAPARTTSSTGTLSGARSGGGGSTSTTSKTSTTTRTTSFSSPYTTQSGGGGSTASKTSSSGSTTQKSPNAAADAAARKAAAARDAVRVARESSAFKSDIAKSGVRSINVGPMGTPVKIGGQSQISGAINKVAQATYTPSRAALAAVTRGPGSVSGMLPGNKDPRAAMQSLYGITNSFNETYNKNYSPADIQEMARAVTGEAVGEGRFGRAAVANTMYNRIRAADADTLWGYMGGNSPRSLLSQYDATGLRPGTSPNAPYTQSIPGSNNLRIGMIALNDAMNKDSEFNRFAAESVKNATHYYNPTQARPDWASGDFTQVGNHLFGNAELSAAKMADIRNAPVSTGVTFTQMAAPQLPGVPQSTTQKTAAYTIKPGSVPASAVDGIVQVVSNPANLTKIAQAGGWSAADDPKTLGQLQKDIETLKQAGVTVTPDGRNISIPKTATAEAQRVFNNIADAYSSSMGSWAPGYGDNFKEGLGTVTNRTTVRTTTPPSREAMDAYNMQASDYLDAARGLAMSPSLQASGTKYASAMPSPMQSMVAGDPRAGLPTGSFPAQRAETTVAGDPRLGLPSGAFPAAKSPSIVAGDPRVGMGIGSLFVSPAVAADQPGALTRAGYDPLSSIQTPKPPSVLPSSIAGYDPLSDIGEYTTPLPTPAPKNVEIVKTPVGTFELPKSIPTKSEIDAYIQQAAMLRNIDPKYAKAVWAGEGMTGNPEEGWQSKIVKNGVREPSYGPYQLHERYLGAEFKAATGLDFRDPRTVYQQIDFALDTAATKKSWGDWYGARDNNIPNDAGLANARPVGVSRSLDGTVVPAGGEVYAKAGMPSGTYWTGTGLTDEQQKRVDAALGRQKLAYGAMGMATGLPIGTLGRLGNWLTSRSIDKYAKATVTERREMEKKNPALIGWAKVAGLQPVNDYSMYTKWAEKMGLRGSTGKSGETRTAGGKGSKADTKAPAEDNGGNTTTPNKPGSRPYDYYLWDLGVGIPSPGEPKYTQYQTYLVERNAAQFGQG